MTTESTANGLCRGKCIVTLPPVIQQMSSIQVGHHTLSACAIREGTNGHVRLRLKALPGS